ncbi:MAG: DHH family phosphoesterase [Candidatus Aenigmarchaeota archaeon]|nr:DHH family phosphoesterase [Candidatus Aenigmarchaeota archaeon]
MEESIIRMVEQAKRIADIIASSDGIRIISHFDCDGIASASIISKALIRLKKRFHVSLVKQLDAEKIEELSSEPSACFIFLDIGSGQLDAIAAHLKGKTVIIADHHQLQSDAQYENISHLNPLLFGIEENISGAGMSYIIARAIDRLNRDLSQIAIVGAIGDAQIGSIGKEWGLLGLNREILKDAVAEGKIKVGKGIRLFGRYTRPVHKALEYCIEPYIPGISGSESAAVHFLHEAGIEIARNDGSFRTLADLSVEEQQRLADHIIVERIAGKVTDAEWIFGDVYELFDKKDIRDANEFATMLNACGKLEKAYIGIALCLSEEAEEAAKDIMEEYRRRLGKAMRYVEGEKSVRETEAAYYLVAGERIPENLIANVASIAGRSIFTGKPLFAFAKTENGKIKVSARLPNGNQINLREIVSRAASAVGGEGGGHMAASGATIPSDSEEKFIDIVEEMLKNAFKHKIDDRPEGKNDGNAAEENRAAIEEERNDGKNRLEGKGLVHYFGS